MQVQFGVTAPSASRDSAGSIRALHSRFWSCNQKPGAKGPQGCGMVSNESKLNIKPNALPSLGVRDLRGMSNLAKDILEGDIVSNHGSSQLMA